MTKNKSKNKKKNDSKFINKYLIITIILVLLVVLTYLFINARDDNTSLTLVEKKWISDNKNTLIDISVPNNLSVLSDNGKGVIFDYIHKVEKDTGLAFNKKSYNYGDKNVNGLAIKILYSSDKIKNRDRLIAEDNYVLVSKKNTNIFDLREIYKQKIGILTNDSDYIKNTIGVNYSYQEYNTLTSLINVLNSNKGINYAVVPRYYALKDLANNNIYINYTFDNISNKIVLRTESKDNLSSIMKKYLANFKNDDYYSSYENAFMNFYNTNSNVSELETSSLSSKVYKYGYIKNSNYNIKNGKSLSGYAGEYITMMSNMANIDMEYKGYKNEEELSRAIETGDVDIAFIDFDYDSNNGFYTSNNFNTSLVALSKTNYQILNKSGLNNRVVYVLDDNSISSYLKNNYKVKVNKVKNIDKKIPDNAIVVMDEIDYYYNTSKNKTEGFYTLFKDSYNSGYNFFIQKDEDVLYKYVTFCLSYIDQNEVKTSTVNKIVNKSVSNNNFVTTYIIIVALILVPIIILFIIVAVLRGKSKNKLLRKESVLKYTDMLTSLKNRNYLRDKQEEWDEVKISPRAVVVIDLNNLSYVNDKYGQEEGNILIKKAAAVLINTQLEKSEIMRTDGNEFLLYLIGYTETQITTYINKLSKELEKLPYKFGAAIGYSMINDEIKTIGDAINEASIAMRKDKEENYK